MNLTGAPRIWWNMARKVYNRAYPTSTTIKAHRRIARKSGSPVGGGASSMARWHPEP